MKITKVKIFCFFLALLQFGGCASMPKPTRPELINEGAPTSIEPVMPNKMDYQLFHKKIAELKGKIQKFHGQDSTFVLLQTKVGELDSTQNENEWKNIKAMKKGATIGAIVPAVFGLSYAMNGFSQTGSGSSSSNAVIGMVSGLFLILTPVFSGVGALAGFLVTGMVTGDDVKKEHKESLVGLISDYNSLDKREYKTQEPDTIK